MSYPQQRVYQPSSRINELLDNIKQEFDNVTSEASAYRMHKDDFEHKINQQNAEMQQVRNMIFDLEATHRKMKEQYEEEIMKLKRELEQRGGPRAPQHVNQASQPPQQQQQPQPQQQQPQQLPPQQQQQQQGQAPGQPPTLGHSSGTGVFGGIMSGQGGPTGLAPPQQQQPQPQQQQQPQQMGGYPGYNGYPDSATNPQHGQPQQPQQQQQPPPPPPQQQQQQPPQQPQQAQAPHQQQNNQMALSPGAKKHEQTSGNGTPIAPKAQPVSSGGQADAQTAINLGNNLGDLDVEKVPAELKKQKDDWFVLYNERAPRLLDVDLVQTLEHTSVVCCVRFSNDGKYVATGCNRSAQIFDVQTGSLIAKLQDDSVEKDGDLYIRSVCFSPDGKYLATGAEDRQIRVWDIKARTIRFLFQGHEQDIYSLDFSRNGRHIASGSGDRTVRMWDMESGQCILTLSIEDGVTTVAISPDGRYVAAGSLDKTVRVWETSTGFLVERLEIPDGHKDSVYSVGFTPDGKQLVSGSLDKTIKLWELQAPQGGHSAHKGGVCVRTFVGHKDFVLSVASTPDSQWILSGSKDRGVQFWDPRTAQVQLMLQGHKNSVISVAPSPNGGFFATGSGDFKARIWRYYPVAR